MRDRQLYAKILGIEPPWSVVDVDLAMSDEEVVVYLACRNGDRQPCPECGRPSPRYDARQRRWRHLDTCQFRTMLEAEVPRVQCEEHGVRQIQVPWAEDRSRFTAVFESLVIDWLKEANTMAVARLLDLTWDEVDGVMDRAVRRGLSRRKPVLPAHIGIDETSFQKRHEYVTVVIDQETHGVIHVADGRKKEALDSFYEQFSTEEKADVRSIAMDMWRPYISSTRDHILDADDKIAFDKFHVAKHLGDAVDRVRRKEHQELAKAGDDRLKGTKYLWLQHPLNISERRWLSFEPLRASSLRTARAWAIKELAMQLWEYDSMEPARTAWLRWYAWAIRSRLEPVRHVAKSVQRHLYGILNAVVMKVTNARSEGINSVIQWIKHSARGFRNRDRYRRAIYFHLGRLDLYPTTLNP